MITRMPSNEEEATTWKVASRAGKEVQLELLKNDFIDAGWQSKRCLDAVGRDSDFYFHPMQQIRMTRWSQNRVVCLGDTAYAPTPLTGMGTSLAITGAYVLAGELSKVTNESNIVDELKSFETVFRPFVEETQKIPPLIPDILHPSTRWKRTLLHGFISSLSMILPLLAKIPHMATVFDHSNKEDFVVPKYEAFDEDD
jgi:2-polyprenyl-6-methoxyphenol hydroxylase-like FAD-dependent oxidoreductase